MVNFLLWLRDMVSKKKSGSRRLCLLVLANSTLCVGWMQTLKDEGLAPDDRHWQNGKQMKVLNLSKGAGEPSSAVVQSHDVVIVSAHAFGTQSTPWMCKYKWHTVVADEAHDFLRGTKGPSFSLTLQNWYILQRQANSVFLLTGTPYTTDVKFDVERVLQAIASEDVRANWGPEYTDEGMRELLRPWQHKGMRKAEPALGLRNDEIAKGIAQKLALYTLRRDENSRIRGAPAMYDFLKDCRRMEEPLHHGEDGKEVAELRAIYEATWRHPGTLSMHFNEKMRCLSYAKRYQGWVSKGGTKQWWEDFTLEEAAELIRPRRLIQILEEAKQGGHKVVIFVHRVFLLELACKVLSSPVRLF